MAWRKLCKISICGSQTGIFWKHPARKNTGCFRLGTTSIHEVRCLGPLSYLSGLMFTWTIVKGMASLPRCHPVRDLNSCTLKTAVLAWFGPCQSQYTNDLSPFSELEAVKLGSRQNSDSIPLQSEKT